MRIWSLFLSIVFASKYLQPNFDVWGMKESLSLGLIQTVLLWLLFTTFISSQILHFWFSRLCISYKQQNITYLLQFTTHLTCFSAGAIFSQVTYYSLTQLTYCLSHEIDHNKNFVLTFVFQHYKVFIALMSCPCIGPKYIWARIKIILTRTKIMFLPQFLLFDRCSKSFVRFQKDLDWPKISLDF